MNIFSRLTHPPRIVSPALETAEQVDAFIDSRALEYSTRLEDQFVERALGLGVGVGSNQPGTDSEGRACHSRSSRAGPVENGEKDWREWLVVWECYAPICRGGSAWGIHSRGA